MCVVGWEGTGHGLPLGANPRSKALWHKVITKFKKNLSTLKRNYLSLGGCIMLIKTIMKKFAGLC